MSYIEMVCSFTKFVTMTSCGLVIYGKILAPVGIPRKRWVFTGVLAILISAAFAFLNTRVRTYQLFLASSLFFGIVCAAVTGRRLDFSLTLTSLSMCVSIVFFAVSVLVVSLLSGTLITKTPKNILYVLGILTADGPKNLLLYFFYSAGQVVLTFVFFSIRRFRRGFPYILGKYTIFFGLIIMGIVLYMAALIGNAKNNAALTVQVFGILLCGAGVITWVVRRIRTYYLRRVRESNVESLEDELRRKNGLIERLSAENLAVYSVNHALSHKLSALELQIMGLAYRAGAGEGAEAAPEYAEILGQLRAMAKDYGDELKKNPGGKKLPATKVPSVDAILEYWRIETRKREIGFDLKINGSILHMTESAIPADRLDTLVGDLVKDAVLAVDEAIGGRRGVLVLLGLEGEHYGLTVFDSGVEFAVGTLLALGLGRVTTRGDTGGGGIGYMTVFETMRECKASLIISEMRPTGGSGFTKSVTVRFDGKNEYRIESYRAEEIRRANAGKRESVLISD